MPKHNYQARLGRIKSRRMDTVLNKAMVAESFNQTTLPETVRYVYEAMREIESAYTKKTYEEAERVQNQITKGLTYGTTVEYQYQGSVPLNTHIRLHSDLDILTIDTDFFTVQPPRTPENPYNGDVIADLRNLRSNVYNTLNSAYPVAIVNNEPAKAISISGGSLLRKFDIIICNWYNTVEYIDAYWKTIEQRGIQIYDRKKDNRFPDYPFSHMAKVEEKNKQSTGENYKRVIRLLKSLKADADVTIDLSSFMITGVMYHMEDYKYLSMLDNTTALLPHVSLHLEKVIDEYQYRQILYSPNKTELLFATDDAKKVNELKKLKKELDDTIEDLASEISPGLSRINEQYGRIGAAHYYEPLQKATYSYRL